MSEGPVLAVDQSLVHLDVASRIDARDESPTKVDRTYDVGLHARHGSGPKIDPDTAREAGENFRDHRRRMKGGIWLEVDDDLLCSGARWLRLARSIGVERSRRHELDDLQRVGPAGA